MSIPYRLLAVDVDGTLMDSRNQLPPGNRDALHRAHEAGLYVCICTGRSLTETREVLDGLGLDLDAGVFVFGAIVSDLATRRTLYRTPIKPDLAARIVRFFSERDYPMLCLHDADQAGFDYLLIHGRRHEKRYEQWLSRSPTRMTRANTWAAGPNEPLRFSVIEEPEESKRLMSELATAFPDNQVKVNPIYAPNYGLHVLECFAPEVNKWHGLSRLMARWNVSASEVVGIGDDVNDLEMITKAGLGIAMGNAVPVVRAAARWHVPSQDAGGLATAVDDLLAGRTENPITPPKSYGRWIGPDA